MISSDFYSKLNPGIRDVVRLLRENGFITTDSGDGVTNVQAGMEGALKIPHVVCRTGEDFIIMEANRMFDLLKSKGIDVGPGQIESVYCPLQKIVTITLWGITNTDLK